VGPLARYEHEVDSGQLSVDDEQRAVKPSGAGFFSRFFKSAGASETGVEGLYLWGGVGRGKTHLCDLFYAELNFEDKSRLHFHRFMQRIHGDLRKLGQVENPIPLVADKWAAQSSIGNHLEFTSR